MIVVFEDSSLKACCDNKFNDTVSFSWELVQFSNMRLWFMAKQIEPPAIVFVLLEILLKVKKVHLCVLISWLHFKSWNDLTLHKMQFFQFYFEQILGERGEPLWPYTREGIMVPIPRRFDTNFGSAGV